MTLEMAGYEIFAAAMLAGTGWHIGAVLGRALAAELAATRGWREWLRAVISLGVGVAAAHGLFYGGLWVWELAA